MTLNKNQNQNKNLFSLIDSLITYEKEQGVRFNEAGFPIFNKEDFLEETGERILPYSHRNDASSKENTVVCFYEPDRLLYRKLTFKKLVAVSEELRKFKGFVGYDLSIFRDFLYPFQKFYILANLVITKFFVIGGNKFHPNLRTDQTDGASYFDLFKEAPVVCCGTLGCSKFKKQRQSNKRLIDKYCDEHPKQLIVQYGPRLCNKPNAKHFKSYGRKKVNING